MPRHADVIALRRDVAAIIGTKRVAKRRRAWRATAKPSPPKIPSSAHRLLLVRGGLVCGSPRCQRHLPTTPPPIVWETCAFWWSGIPSTITHTSISIMPGFYCGRSVPTSASQWINNRQCEGILEEVMIDYVQGYVLLFTLH